MAPSGLKIKVKVYTVPGQVKHDATRKAVLQRADGVAFIADSQVRERSNNVYSFSNLEDNLAMVGLDLEELPLVIQYNKRDLVDIESEDDIRITWQATGIPVFFASALKGGGVVETFRKLVQLTYRRLDQRFQFKESHGLGEEEFINGLIRPQATFTAEQERAGQQVCK